MPIPAGEHVIVLTTRSRLPSSQLNNDSLLTSANSGWGYRPQLFDGEAARLGAGAMPVMCSALAASDSPNDLFPVAMSVVPSDMPPVPVAETGSEILPTEECECVWRQMQRGTVLNQSNRDYGTRSPCNCTPEHIRLERPVVFMCRGTMDVSNERSVLGGHVPDIAYEPVIENVPEQVLPWLPPLTGDTAE